MPGGHARAGGMDVTGMDVTGAPRVGSGVRSVWSAGGVGRVSQGLCEQNMATPSPFHDIRHPA
eukprot:3337999-Pyramimonas_sp.AAC.1